jgi:hypothetical protein
LTERAVETSLGRVGESDDFDALVEAERTRLVQEAAQRDRAEREIAEETAEARAAARRASARLAASTRELEALARSVSNRLSEAGVKSRFVFGISAHEDSNHPTWLPRKLAWPEAVCTGTHYSLYLCTNGRLFEGLAYDYRLAFHEWAQLEKKNHEEIRRGLARLVALYVRPK